MGIANAVWEKINPDNISGEQKPSTGRAVIVPTVEKMLRYADQLGMSVTSTYCSDEFASVKGIKDGREITILQYREVAKNA